MNTTRTMLLLVLSLGCGPGAEVEAERDRLLTRVADLEKEKGRLEKEADALHGQVRKLRTELKSLERAAVFSQLGIGDDGTLGVRFVTSMGTVACELWPADAPKTVLNFVGLAEGTKAWTDPKTDQKVQRPLYDGTIFHRVIPKFMVQGGDPLGSGKGGPGYRFEDEVDSGKLFDGPGLLAMANSGPNTNGSQFFITDRSTPTHLNGKHTIFGKCDDLDIVQAITSVDRDGRDRPLVDVVLQRVVIVR